MGYLTFKEGKEGVKNIAYLAISVVSAVIVYCYYDGSSAKSSLLNVKEEISTLIEESSKIGKKGGKDTATFISDIKSAKLDLMGNKYVTPGIKKWFETDVEKKLMKLDTSNLGGRNDGFFDPLIASYKGGSNNQAIASVLIYLFFFIFLSLALFSNILRYVVNAPIIKQEVQNESSYPPFSLSQTQLGTQ